MSKVFTGNIFLSTSRSIIDKFMRKQPLNSQEKESSIIVGPGKNRNLVSFNYSFGSIAGADQKLVVLRFLEFGTAFEKYYLEANLTNTISKDAAGGLFTKNLYLAFGVGDDLSAWAGPFILSLIQANYVINGDGRREVIMRLCPVTGPINKNYVVNSSIQNKSLRINQSQQITPAQSLFSDPYIIKYGDKLNNEKIDEALVKIIKSYFQKTVNNSDVIILLPKVGKELVKYNAGIDIFQNHNFQKFFGDIGLMSEIIEKKPQPGPSEPHQIKKKSSESNANNIKLYIASNPSLLSFLDSTPDFYIPVNNVNKKISKIFGKSNLQFRPYFICEDNATIIDFWKKYFGVRRNATSVFVYGDERLISTLLYLENVETTSDLSINYPSKVEPNEETKKYENGSYRADYIKLIKNKSSFHRDVANKLSLEDTDSDNTLVVDFRYNVKDPNILSLTTNSLPGYISVFNPVFEKAQVLQSINSKKNLLFSKIIPASKKLLEVIQRNNSNNFFLQKLKDYVQTAVSKVLTYFDQNSTAKKSSTIFVESDQTAKQYENLLLDAFRRTVFKISIKTIPFFNITSLTSLGRKCKLTTNLISTVGNYDYSKSFLDGNYRILGFNHVINEAEMYSEFTLIKDYKEDGGIGAVDGGVAAGTAAGGATQPQAGITGGSPAAITIPPGFDYDGKGGITPSTAPNPIQSTIIQEEQRVESC